MSTDWGLRSHLLFSFLKMRFPQSLEMKCCMSCLVMSVAGTEAVSSGIFPTTRISSSAWNVVGTYQGLWNLVLSTWRTPDARTYLKGIWGDLLDLFSDSKIAFGEGGGETNELTEFVEWICLTCWCWKFLFVCQIGFSVEWKSSWFRGWF